MKEFFQRADAKEQYDEKRIQDEQNFMIGATSGKEMRCEEDRREDEELFVPHANSIFGLCAICHLTLGNINSNLNTNLPCSKAHTLCQRCIQNFTVQPG